MITSWPACSSNNYYYIYSMGMSNSVILLNIIIVPSDGDPIPSQILSYNRANRAVAILCNHQVCIQCRCERVV